MLSAYTTGTNYVLDRDYGTETLSGSNSYYSETEAQARTGRAPYSGLAGTYVYMEYVLIAENAASEPTYVIGSEETN